jgi:hypothetical protein
MNIRDVCKRAMEWAHVSVPEISKASKISETTIRYQLRKNCVSAELFAWIMRVTEYPIEGAVKEFDVKSREILRLYMGLSAENQRVVMDILRALSRGKK